MKTTACLGAGLAVVTALVAVTLLLPASDDGAAAPSAPASDGPPSLAGSPRSDVPRDEGGEEPPQGPRLDRAQHSTTDPASIWVVVNKTHPVEPADFRPEIGLVRGYQVATPVVGPLTALLADSDAAGLGFKIASAFRSYDYQASVHEATVAERGQDAADLVSARPGHSEHQTGLAVDLVTPADPGCDFDACFADTPGGQWLAANAWRYGFVVRYQPGTTAVTGYQPEPWHLRFVGRELAAELRRTAVATLEEFFGIPGGDYPAS